MMKPTSKTFFSFLAKHTDILLLLSLDAHVETISDDSKCFPHILKCLFSENRMDFSTNIKF